MSQTIPQSLSDLGPEIQSRCLTVAQARAEGIQFEEPVRPYGYDRPLAIGVQRRQIAGVEYRSNPRANWWQVETLLMQRPDYVCVLIDAR